MAEKSGSEPNLYLALVHFPVVNKNGDTIASAVTNLDLHDISRAARTYGAKRFFVVTPLADQKELIRRIVSHWVDGHGARYNPKRGAALEMIRIRDSLYEAVEEIRSRHGSAPRVVGTSARKRQSCIGYGRCSEMIRKGTPHLLVFGTAWGLSESLLRDCDVTLEPIIGRGEYNHLSVRSAAAIILDRLMGG